MAGPSSATTSELIGILALAVRGRLKVDTLVETLMVHPLALGEHQRCRGVSYGSEFRYLVPDQNPNPNPKPKLKASMIIQVIGCPEDLGQTKRGVDMGPSAIGLPGWSRRLGPRAHRHRLGRHRHLRLASEEPGNPNLRWVDQVVKDMEVLADVVEAAVRAERFPAGPGRGQLGEHRHHGRVGQGRAPQGLIWVDAHPDFNIPETTPSGNIHGMPVAAIVGDGDPRLIEVGGVTPKVLEENLVWIALA